MSENVQSFSGKVNVADNLLVGTAHFFVDRQNNRVGIGTSTPDASSMLDVTGNIKSGGTITATGGFSGNGSLLSGVNSDSGSWVNGSSSNIHLAVSGDKVGIGVVSPGAELHVGGTGAIIVPAGTTDERPGTAVNGMFRYNSETGYMETYTAGGWGSIAPPPVITGISPTSVLGADTATQVFTVTGTGFDTGLSIKLVGADGTEYSVFNTTRVSGQSATFKMGASGASGGYDAAQRPFNVKVIGGDTASAVTSTSTASIALVAPTITGISPTTFAASAIGSQTITVTGTNFASSMASGNNIQVLGADGSTLYNVNSAAVASATSITFKLAATGASLTTGQLDNRPYKVRVTDAIGITATSTQTIGFNGIAWSSPASGATLTYTNGVSSSQNLVATDDVGGTGVTFSITSGSVAGLSLGSASASPATFSGSGTTNGTTNVTFRVTDNVTGTTADRTFSVVVNPDLLYNFSSHTFTNLGGFGYAGPNVSANSYSGQPFSGDSSLFTQVSGQQGYQLWTVPKTGTYSITATGARGGGNLVSASRGGAGAVTSARFNLTIRDKIIIIVGQNGLRANTHQYSGAGGGGGTYVLKEGAHTGTADTGDIYMIAGGGGGSAAEHFIYNNQPAGAAGTSQSTGSGTGGIQKSNYNAGAGAGYSQNGFATNSAEGSLAGAFGYRVTGGQGGNGGYKATQGAAQYNYSGYGYQHGGFGGGGSYSVHSGGGGGGFNGGDSGVYNHNPGAEGGSPYIMPSATNQSFALSNRNSSQNGLVVITKIT